MFLLFLVCLFFACPDGRDTCQLLGNTFKSVELGTTTAAASLSLNLVTLDMTTRQLAAHRNEEVAFGHFMKNKQVQPQQIFDSNGQRTAVQQTGRHVLWIEDTSTMSFGLTSGLGQVGKSGRLRGFYLHPLISVDADTYQVLGLAQGHIYQRRGRGTKSVAQRKCERTRERLAEKESYRWLSVVERALQYNMGARRPVAR